MELFATAALVAAVASAGSAGAACHVAKLALNEAGSAPSLT